MKQLNRYATILVPVFIIVPFVVISFYNHPALDDWWYAETYKQNGFWGAQQYWYNHYTARFFSNFIMTIAPLSFGWAEGHKVMPIVFLLCLYGTMYKIAETVFNNFSAKKNVLALWFAATYLLIQRDYFESIYWLAANVVYQYAMLFLLLHINLIYQIFVQNEYKIRHCVLVVLLSVAITGSNESLGGLVLVEAIGMCIISFYQKRLQIFTASFLLVQIVSWAIMFMAPGNWAKIHDATQDHVYTFFFAKAIGHSFLSVGYYSVYLLKQQTVWCLILLSIPIFKSFLNEKLKLKNPLFFITFSAVSFCIAVAIYFISIYPTGILIPPLRITNIAIIFLFSGIALAVCWLIEKLNLLEKFAIMIQKNKALVMVASFVFAIITPTKFHQLLMDLTTGKAAKYNKTMYDRYSTLKSTNTDTCYLPALTNVPRTIVATDVGTGFVGEHIGLIFGKSNKVIFK